MLKCQNANPNLSQRMTHRSYKFRFYPNRTQEKQLAKMFGSARWVWNHALDWRSSAYKVHGESVNGVDFSRELTFLKTLEPYAWLKDTPFTVYSQVLRDQDDAFRSFFAKRTKYPKFKNRRSKQSIRFNLDQRRLHTQFINGEMLKLPVLGKLKIRWSRLVAGTPKMVTVSKDASGRYFVSMSAESQIEHLPQKTNAVGLDFGVIDTIVTSDGWKSGNPRPMKALERKLKRAQQALSRCKNLSKRREKARLRVAKIYAKIKDVRADWLHKLSRLMIDQYQTIFIEDLDVQSMIQSPYAKSLSDSGFGMLRIMLTYKADWYGRKLVAVDRWAPTTKTCSECGFVSKKIPTNVRSWKCPDCAAEHDRDVNAARNVFTRGMASVRSTDDKERGEAWSFHKVTSVAA
jgi:putative transposase